MRVATSCFSYGFSAAFQASSQAPRGAASARLWAWPVGARRVPGSALDCQTLTRALQDPDPDVRATALISLERISYHKTASDDLRRESAGLLLLDRESK